VRHFNFAVSTYFKQLDINALTQENMRLNVKLLFNMRTLVGYDFGRMNRARMPKLCNVDCRSERQGAMNNFRGVK
jgi:hypothetical protein